MGAWKELEELGRERRKGKRESDVIIYLNFLKKDYSG